MRTWMIVAEERGKPSSWRVMPLRGLCEAPEAMAWMRREYPRHVAYLEMVGSALEPVKLDDMISPLVQGVPPLLTIPTGKLHFRFPRIASTIVTIYRNLKKILENTRDKLDNSE